MYEKKILEQAAVMLAFIEGKKIEVRNISSSIWRDDDTPFWDWWHNDYRIKPEPPIEVIFWGIVNEKEKVLQMYQNKQDAVNMCSYSYKQRVIKFICNEVPENAA